MRYALVFALAASWTASAHGEEAEPGVLREPGRTVVVRRQAHEKAPVAQPECSAWMDAASLRDLVRQEARKQGVDEKAALAILNEEFDGWRAGQLAEGRPWSDAADAGHRGSIRGQGHLQPGGKRAGRRGLSSKT